MDKVVNHIFEYQGEGLIKDFPGNYTQLRDKKDEAEMKAIAAKMNKTSKPVAPSDSSEKRDKKPGLTFKEKREFEELTIEINNLETEKREIEDDMNQGFISKDTLYLKSTRHSEIVKMLDNKEMRWLELSEK
jgi:ATP-binding cassette subfamily F protein uup